MFPNTEGNDLDFKEILLLNNELFMIELWNTRNNKSIIISNIMENRGLRVVYEVWQF